MSATNPTTTWEGSSFRETPVRHESRSFSTPLRYRRPITAARLARLEAAEAEISEKLRQTLDERVADVAIVSRVGSNLSRHRFVREAPRYTHSAFVRRRPQGWEVYHVLNTLAGSEGDLCRQSLVDFARDDPWKYRFEVMTLVDGVQERLQDAFATPLPRQIHRRSYSAIAHPQSRRYQQSNQWLVEVLGACMLGRGDETRAGVQSLLQKHGLMPSVIRKRVLAGFVGQWVCQAWSKNLRFDDHPLAARAAGEFAFVSSKSVRDLLVDNDWLASHCEVFVGAPLGATWPDESLIGSQDL